MNSSYIAVFILIFVVLITIQERNNLLRLIIRRKKQRRGNLSMNEIIKNYIGKDCVIYLSNSSSVITGCLISLNDNWITVKTKDGDEILNIDYIVRLKEHPVNSKGKKKQIF